jgi:endonuclease YncB( thermonuclease family)
MTVPPVDPNWTHPADVVRIIDGDTFVARIDLGKYPMKVQIEVTIRIAGLYAPERRDPGGPEATAALRSLLGFSTPYTEENDPIVLRTRKSDPRDPYGRVVADVWADGVNVAEAMIDAGHGKGAP